MNPTNNRRPVAQQRPEDRGKRTLTFRPNASVRRFLSIVAGFGFVAAALAYVLSFARGYSYTYPVFIILFLGIFPLFGLMLFMVKDRWRTLRGITSSLPTWGLPLFVAGAILVAVNIGLFSKELEGGLPDKRNGEYVIHNHGRIIRKLTEEEFHAKQGWVLRLILGNVAYFYFVPMVCFRFLKDENAVAADQKQS